MIFTNEKGEEVEAYTPDEVKDRIEEIKADATATNEAEHSNLLEQLADKEKELEILKEKSGGMGTNLSNQRKIIDSAKDEKEALAKKIEELSIKTEELETKFSTANKDSLLDSKIKDITTDKNVAAKMKKFYNDFNGDPKDDADMNERIKNSYVLSTSVADKSIFNSGILSSSGNSPTTPNSAGKLSPGAEVIAANMGISREDLKKAKLL